MKELNYFCIEKAVDRVHGVVDRRCSRSMVDSLTECGRSSLECGLTDDAMARSLPQLQKKIEGPLENLTICSEGGGGAESGQRQGGTINDGGAWCWVTERL
jgi:hypothetical protein